MKRPIFVAPHNDDETLFGAFTIMQHRPAVIVVFDGYIQAARGLPVTAAQRRVETLAALGCLGMTNDDVVFVGLHDDKPVQASEIAGGIRWALALLECTGGQLWAPAYEDRGHRQHNLVAEACHQLVRHERTRYLTYTENGKSRSARIVVPHAPAAIAQKHRALACYTSQLDPRMGCWPHFMDDLREYYAD